jgi:UDPglucose 6-dehydrogenase
MTQIRTVSVCGLGKLGGCMAAVFAARGFEVVGLDIDADKVRKVNRGQPPVPEPLLAETMRAGAGRLRATLDPREAAATDATLFIPPSPSLPDGSFSNAHLLKAMRLVAKAVRAAGREGHLLKISFTNQLRMIAERHPHADIHAILDAIGSDRRVGRHYLRPEAGAGPSAIRAQARCSA